MKALRQGIRDLPGQPRRCRRRARRRDPAGRGLHREERDLRQHRGPGADDRPAAFAPGEAKEDWAIVRALSAHVGHTLPYDSASGPARGHVQGRRRRWRASMRWSRPTAKGWKRWRRAAARWASEPFGAAVRDFYLTNPIARASAVMAELSALQEEHGARDHGNAWLSAWSWPEIWQGYLWPLLVMAFWSVLLLVVLLVCVAFLLLMDRKVWAAVQLRRGPNVVGPVRAAAVVRRPAEVRAQGAADPGRRRQGRVPAGAAGGLRAGAGRLGRDPASTRTAGAAGSSPTSTSASSTCSRSPRSASTASSWAAGRPTRSMPSSARCGRPRRWCPTRSRSASSSSRCCCASARST